MYATLVLRMDETNGQPSGDMARHSAATSHDMSRHAATTSDNEFSLSIDDASALYEQAGHPRTPRSIQRYCAKGHLEYRRLETPFGDKFLITPASVMKHIAYINDVRLVATGRDMPRHVATDVVGENKEIELQPAPPTSSDQSRQPATDDRYVAALERENEFLRGQVTVKDTQISELQVRAHETNSLINGLQRLLALLLSAPERDVRHRDHTTDDERN
jgi:hypothetical protein